MSKQEEMENICCPALNTVECVDTKGHCHLVCAFSNGIISNKTAKEICLGDFNKCAFRQSEWKPKMHILDSEEVEKLWKSGEEQIGRI